MMKDFIAIFNFDEEMANTYKEAYELKDTTPEEFLRQEFGWVSQSGVSLDNGALVGKDVKWERYLRYLVEWAISHKSKEYAGMSPASYAAWCVLEESGSQQ